MCGRIRVLETVAMNNFWTENGTVTWNDLHHRDDLPHPIKL